MRWFLWGLNFLLPMFISRYFVPAFDPALGNFKLVAVPREAAVLMPRYIKITYLMYWNTAILHHRKAYQQRR